MKRTKQFMKVFSLLIALSVLPLFLTGHNIRGADGSRSGLLYPETRIVTNHVCSLPVAAYTEELLHIRQSGIASEHAVRRSDRPQMFSIYYNEHPAHLQISLLLLTAALLLRSGADYGLKSIIKYIHDQDGRKKISPYIVKGTKLK